MATSLSKSPSATTFDVEELVTRAWSGNIRVPHFQRDFRWTWEDVRRLFDSIIRGYPLGSLLLWERYAPAGIVELGRLSIEAREVQRAYWVVDGQQRLTSLANALHPSAGVEGQFALSYNLRRKEFTKPPKAFDTESIPLPTLFDLQQVILWFVENPTAAQYLEHATRVTKTLRQYEVPVYVVNTDDAEVLQDIFDRMNNYGKRLTRAEIFTALNATAQSYDRGGTTLEGIASSIDRDFNFGIIDTDTILACVLARRGPEVRRDIRAEFESEGDEGLERAYSEGEAAIRRAVDFLQGEAGVPHYSFVAYHYLLVVVSRMFALHPDLNARNRRLLRRWFWQAAVVGPGQFKGGTPNAARILCGRIDADESESVQRLLHSITSVGAIYARRFAANEAATKIFLCALWSRGPRDPSTGELYTFSDLADSLADSRTAQPAIRQILPRPEIPEKMRPWAANRILMPQLSFDSKELLPRIAGIHSDMSSKDWRLMTDSHCLTHSLLHLRSEWNPGAFLSARQDELEAVLERFIASRAEWGFENTPPLADLNFDDEA